ncbi:XAC2610-related protein, partial [Segatella copri]
IKIKRSMKKIVFILLIFCSFLVVWGCNKNKTKCVPQKEATSDSSMRSNDDTLSLMIEHEVDDVDYGVIIKRGDKTIHRFGYKYPEDDDLVPNEERIDSCLLTDLNFDGIKEDVLFYLGSFGASGTEHFDAYVWNPNTEHYDKIEEFKDIPNPKISDKYKCILSRVYVSSAENEYAKYVCTNGHLIKVAELRQYWKGNIYPERDRAVYEEHFIKANVWKRNLKLNQISDFWKPVVPF